MNEVASLPLPAPTLSCSAIEDKWQREFQAFQALKPNLLADLAGQYVAIHNGQVVANGADEVALGLEFFAKYGNVPVHIGLITDRPEKIVRIPHYRNARPGDSA